ncbi:MAG TPA: ABC transporter ATP-binding protein [Geminicoccaceae bacterium]|nr:ABC transporter ATP-binding protein [Geminicoccaceae bacterium]
MGGRPVLRGRDAALTGRSIGLLGPNGAGKTTLIHTILGFHHPAAGSVRVLGHEVGKGTKSVRALLGYMPEGDSFIAGMSGLRFVRYMAELSGLPAEPALERAHEAMFYVGLGEARYRPIASYSLGMRQLVKLAQAIVHGPQLLLLDEPTNGLDPPARRRMIKLIRDIARQGDVRILLSSHLLRDVEECCEDVLVLKEGRIALACNLAEERRTNRRFLELEIGGAAGEQTAAFTAGAERLGCETAVLGRRVKLVLPQDVEVRDLYKVAAEAKAEIRRLSYRRDSLEDIFLKAMETSHGSR